MVQEKGKMHEKFQGYRNKSLRNTEKTGGSPEKQKILEKVSKGKSKDTEMVQLYRL